METRIKLEDDLMSAVLKLSDGNPGALSALMEMAQNSPEVDPDSFGGVFSPLRSLDMHNIYGTDVYVLWYDICGKCNVTALAVLRATQLGFLPSAVLKDACSRQDRSGRSMINTKELYSSVKERLPNFDSQNLAKN